MKWLPLLLLLTGCEMLDARDTDNRKVEHDCTLTHHDGTTMHCGQSLTKDIEAIDQGKSVGMEMKVPVTP